MAASMPALEIKTVPDHERLLTTPCVEVEFPLSQETQAFIQALKEKVIEIDAAGLAATQVGSNLRIIAYQVSALALSIRVDAEKVVPLTALINPSYEIINEEERTLDWEGCFSIPQQLGKIWRATRIKYRGFDEEGRLIEGEAKGFLARLLQHEIDHINGKLCRDKYPEGGFYGDAESMKIIRMEEIAARTAIS